MTSRRGLITLILVLASVATGASRQVAPRPQSNNEPVVVPFELLTRHILLRVRIGNSGPLWFIFDTGDNVAIVDLERARSLGLNLHGEVKVGGAGPGVLKGARVRDATLTVIGVEGNPQPVVMAIPMDNLKPRFGQNIDGIIGSEFIKQFVVEVDYQSRVLRLHDKSKFVYAGQGGVIPAELNRAGHPIIPAEITVAGRPPIKGKFVIDLGSGGSLALHRPFVESERLYDPAQKTIRAMGGGAGGRISGRVGRVAGLRIGRFQIDNPIALFSEDRSGAFASTEFQGNIGAQIISRFLVFLDYERNRIILEPNSSYGNPIEPVQSGLRLIADGADYKTLRVEDLLEDSPATEAGLQKDDIVLSIDGRPASELTLSALNVMLEKPVSYKLTVRRGDKTLEVRLTPRRLI